MDTNFGVALSWSMWGRTYLRRRLISPAIHCIPVGRDPHQLGMSFQFKLKRAGNASFLLWNWEHFTIPARRFTWWLRSELGP